METPLLSGIRKKAGMETPTIKSAVLGNRTFADSMGTTMANRNAAMNVGRTTPTRTIRPSLLSGLTRFVSRRVSARGR